jgi:hypothetical protein
MIAKHRLLCPVIALIAAALPSCGPLCGLGETSDTSGYDVEIHSPSGALPRDLTLAVTDGGATTTLQAPKLEMTRSGTGAPAVSCAYELPDGGTSPSMGDPPTATVRCTVDEGYVGYAFHVTGTGYAPLDFVAHKDGTVDECGAGVVKADYTLRPAP